MTLALNDINYCVECYFLGGKSHKCSSLVCNNVMHG